MPVVVTMKKYHVVKQGVFEVVAVFRVGDAPEFYRYHSWELAYRRFRYFSSFLGWDFVRLVYRGDYVYRRVMRHE